MAASPIQQEPQLRITRHYPVGCDKVWRAWTEPQALSRWFGPGEANSVTRADMDVQVGGRYHIAFKTPDGQEHNVSGVYQEVVENRKLVFSWAWKSTPERVSRVTIELRPEGGGCELRFLHEKFFNPQACDDHLRGWTATFAKLDGVFA